MGENAVAGQNVTGRLGIVRHAARKLPAEAFDYYSAEKLAKRGGSYRSVAKRYGVSESEVYRVARLERWTARFEEIEEEAALSVKRRIVRSVEETARRHLQAYRLVRLKAIRELRNLPFDTAAQCVAALDIAAKGERLILGEPTERTSHTLQEIMRREYDACFGEEVTEAEYTATQEVSDSQKTSSELASCDPHPCGDSSPDHPGVPVDDGYEILGADS